MAYSSFEVDFSSLESCLSFAAAELEPFGLALPRDMRARLSLEAVKDKDGVTVYRIYSRLAAVLSRAVNTTHLNEGKGGAAFRNADKTIAEWRNEQAEIDRAVGVPLASSTKRTGSRSIPIRSSF